MNYLYTKWMLKVKVLAYVFCPVVKQEKMNHGEPSAVAPAAVLGLRLERKDRGHILNIKYFN